MYDELLNTLSGDSTQILWGWGDWKHLLQLLGDRLGPGR